MLTSLTDDRFARFAERVRACQRHAGGHYLIDMVSVAALRSEGRSDAEIADVTSEHFDDHEWPIRSDPTIPVPEHWTAISEARAAEYMIEQLAGGPAFGCTAYAIQPAEAAGLWRTFRSFFTAPCTLFMVNLGSPEFVFNGGILIVDQAKAGVLHVSQND